MRHIFYRVEPFLLFLVAFLFALHLYSVGDSSNSDNVSPTSVRQTVAPGAYFDADIAPMVRSFVSDARHSLTVVSFTCHEGRVIKALRAAAERGVSVTLICGKKEPLISGRMKVLFRSPKRGILHEKFLVRDKRDAIIMTANISDVHHNNTAVLFTDVPRLSALLLEEKKHLIAGMFDRRCADGCPFERGTIFFSPGACRAVAKRIAVAHRSLRGAVYTATEHNPIFTAIMKVIRRGVPVTLIFDDWESGGREVNRPACLLAGYSGGNALFDHQFIRGYNRLLHDKIALVDHSTVIVGSMNWTSSACYRNRELVVIVDDGKLVDAVDKHISALLHRARSCVTKEE